ncbi:MAG: hypothetical protein ACI89X_003766 [Planctomycetota bacterium]|jgi:hypothetical protein
MVNDLARQRLVMFGGLTNTGKSHETWEWDGNNWDLRTPIISPPARLLAAMAYDESRQRTVLFGGSTDAGFANDTWEWDGNNWLLIVPPTPAPVRDTHAMAYDAARGNIVMFGGVGLTGTILGDTWTWDGATWQQATPTASPPPRRGHKMCYDPTRQRVVLFGGSWGLSGGAELADTWEWDGTDWTATFTMHYPPARSDHALVFDERRQRVLLFGGYKHSIGPLNDTWELDANNWQEMAASNSPPPRLGHALAFDPQLQRAILFGGNAGGTVNDTWWNTAPPVPAVATNYGAGCGTPPLTFSTSSAPIIGDTATATITNVTSPIAGVALGWNDDFYGPFSLPVTLGGIGMPGCYLLHSADSFGLGGTMVNPTTMEFSLALPNVPAIIGTHAYLQAYSVAPGMNALQLIASNGIDWQFGSV